MAKKALSLGRVGALIESSMGKANTSLSNLSLILPTQRKGFVDVSETQYMNPLLDDPANITGVTQELNIICISVDAVVSNQSLMVREPMADDGDHVLKVIDVAIRPPIAPPKCKVGRPRASKKRQTM